MGTSPRSEAQARELTPVRSLNVRARIVERVERVERAGGWAARTAADVARIRDEEVEAWRASQRRAESRTRGRGLIQTLTGLGSGDWSLADDFGLDGQAPYGLDEGAPSGLERRERVRWFEHAVAGAHALAADLPRLRSRIAFALELRAPSWTSQTAPVRPCFAASPTHRASRSASPGSGAPRMLLTAASGGSSTLDRNEVVAGEKFDLSLADVEAYLMGD